MLFVFYCAVNTTTILAVKVTENLFMSLFVDSTYLVKLKMALNAATNCKVAKLFGQSQIKRKHIYWVLLTLHFPFNNFLCTQVFPTILEKYRIEIYLKYTMVGIIILNKYAWSIKRAYLTHALIELFITRLNNIHDLCAYSRYTHWLINPSNIMLKLAIKQGDIVNVLYTMAIILGNIKHNSNIL